VLLQVASLGWSLGSAYSRRFSRDDHVLGTTALQMLAGGVMLGLLGLARGEAAHLTFTTRTSAALFYLATLGAIGGFVAYTYALRHLPVSFVSLYAYINPIIAVTLGVLLLGEPFNVRIAVAAALVLIGVAIVRSKATSGLVAAAFRRKIAPRSIVVVACLASVVAGGGLASVDAQVLRNAGKYGAMFSWWYDSLPRQTLYRPTVEWDARKQQWWNAMVKQAGDAGLGWLAAACWGRDTTADPVMLEPLLRAIDANGGKLKIAMFDDTTSEVLRKNLLKHGEWSLTPRFDLADPGGRGEGGLAYFYDDQWKRFFATVPERYLLKINGRPVVFMWHGGFQWYQNQHLFHTLLDDLRAATRRDFNLDPFIIVEESWQRLDPDVRPDGLLDWFGPPTFSTLMEYGGIHVGHVVPGYDCSRCESPGPVIDRENGQVFRAGLDAVAARSDLVLVEGFVNVDENAHLVETTTWGRQYINLMKWYAVHIP
jgi:uncharacterized membrane protein